MPLMQTRRCFLTTLSLAGAAGLLRWPAASAAEGMLETTTVQLAKRSLCNAPEYVAEELLRAEGFTEIRFIDTPVPDTANWVAQGKIDFSLGYSSYYVAAIDAGEPVVLLAGVHVGCFELFAGEGIRRIADLKGKSVGVNALGSGSHVFLAAIAAHVGLDPAKDLRWVATGPSVDPLELFAGGKIDAFLAFPPAAQDLRARNIGHVIFNSSIDPPWSQYFCCMQAANREFVRNYPIATKRVLRAILKACHRAGSRGAAAGGTRLHGPL